MGASVTPSNIMPIRVAPDGRYFLDKAGAPFFLLGDTQWQIFRSHPPADVEGILQNRRAQGFNTLLIMLIGYEETPQPNLNGELPFVDQDPSRPNERYFAHIDKVMEVASRLDFIQICGVYHKSQGALYTPEKARASARWIAQRYKDVPQIIWSMYPEARWSYIPVMRALVDGLREGDGGRHLITVHPDPSPQSSSAFPAEQWIAFHMSQPWRDLQLVYPMALADYCATPIRPVVMAEGGYEAAPLPSLEWRLEASRLRAQGIKPGPMKWEGEITPADVRRMAYWTYLAGGYHVYGHNSSHNDVENWKSWTAAPGAQHIGVFRKVITALPKWWDVVPDQSLFTRGFGEGNRLNAAARSAHGEWVLVYLSSPGAPVVRTDMVKSSDRCRAWWINPVNGERMKIGELAYGDPREFVSPAGWEDALLLMEAVA